MTITDSDDIISEVIVAILVKGKDGEISLPMCGRRPTSCMIIGENDRRTPVEEEVLKKRRFLFVFDRLSKLKYPYEEIMRALKLRQAFSIWLFANKVREWKETLDESNSLLNSTIYLHLGSTVFVRDGILDGALLNVPRAFTAEDHAYQKKVAENIFDTASQNDFFILDVDHMVKQLTSFSNFAIGLVEPNLDPIYWQRVYTELGLPMPAHDPVRLAKPSSLAITRNTEPNKADGVPAKWNRELVNPEDERSNARGLSYAFGRGVQKDEVEAVKWYRKAADQGHAEAQYNLGVCYKNGTGVTKDENEAVKWYRKSAEQGYASAQFDLGQCCAHCQGVIQDHAQAVKWNRKAADQGHARAQYLIGLRSKDKNEAVKWYRKAADQGEAGAQYFLGVCYKLGVCPHTGQGVTKDEAEAAKWFRKAADQGDELALRELGERSILGRLSSWFK
jgi:hypothetical protein